MFSVIIPVLNNAESISRLVDSMRNHPLVREIIVVDDGSTDETPAIAKESGATVILSSMLGKGASMQDGLMIAQAERILFLDGSICSLSSSMIDIVYAALERKADFVKARLRGPEDAVSLLTARPLLNVFFPALSSFSHPLCGIVAASKQYLLTQVFEDGYGVDIGLLIDSHLWQANIVEVDVGAVTYSASAPTDILSIAGEVVRVILDRSNKSIRRHDVSRGVASEPKPVSPAALISLSQAVRSRAKLALIDLDIILIEGRFLAALAQQSGRERALDECKTACKTFQISGVNSVQ